MTGYGLVKGYLKKKGTIAMDHVNHNEKIAALGVRRQSLHAWILASFPIGDSMALDDSRYQCMAHGVMDILLSS